MRAIFGTRLYLALPTLCAVLAILSGGCGGGSSHSLTKSAPTRATKDRIQLMQTQNVRLLAQNGGQSASLASVRNGAFINGAPASGVAANGGGNASLNSGPSH